METKGAARQVYLVSPTTRTPPPSCGTPYATVVYGRSATSSVQYSYVAMPVFSTTYDATTTTAPATPPTPSTASYPTTTTTVLATLAAPPPTPTTTAPAASAVGHTASYPSTTTYPDNTVGEGLILVLEE